METITTFGENSPEMRNLLKNLNFLLKSNSMWRSTPSMNYMPKTIEFIESIKENNAIIAGDALVTTINHTVMSDIDIYVNLQYAQSLVNKLALLNYIVGDSKFTSVYDKYMLRNNVLGTLLYYNFTKKKVLIKIMLVKNNIPLNDVVSNFDLNFSKIWTNGSEIYTKHLEDVKSKTSKLDEEHFRKFLVGNNFTINRLNNYKKRDYIIEYPDIDTSLYNYDEDEDIKLSVFDEEEWVIMYILKNLKSFVNNIMLGKGFFISFEVYVLSLLEADNVSRYRWFKLLEIIDTIYKTTYNDSTFTITEAINGLIMYDKNGFLNICYWEKEKYLEYFERFNIKIRAGEGYNREEWNFCQKNQILQENLTSIDVYALYQTFLTYYPNIENITEEPLIRLSPEERMRQIQEEQRKRNAELLLEGTEIVEKVSASGLYRTGIDTKIPARCFNIMEPGQINSEDWDNEQGNVYLIIEYNEKVPDVVCTSVNEINTMLSDPDKLMYKCGGFKGYRAGTDEFIDDVRNFDGPYDLLLGNVDRSVTYVPFTYGSDGNFVLIGYISRDDAQTIISIASTSDQVPIITLNFVDTITHTIDVKNADNPYERNYIGANHCQSGSAISIFKIGKIERSISNADMFDL